MLFNNAEKGIRHMLFNNNESIELSRFDEIINYTEPIFQDVFVCNFLKTSIVHRSSKYFHRTFSLLYLSFPVGLREGKKNVSQPLTHLRNE